MDTLQSTCDAERAEVLKFVSTCGAVDVLMWQGVSCSNAMSAAVTSIIINIIIEPVMGLQHSAQAWLEGGSRTLHGPKLTNAYTKVSPMICAACLHGFWLCNVYFIDIHRHNLCVTKLRSCV